MKAINVSAIMTSIRSKVDGSLGINLSTPELTPEDKAEFMRLQNAILDCTFIPADMLKVEEYKIDKVLEKKTPSERLRSVLYVYWQYQGEQGDFNDFYRKYIERIIDSIKVKLPNP